MSFSSKPTFVLVPPSFANPIFYHKLQPLLTSKGYTSTAVRLPSAGDQSPLPPATMADDAAHIRQEILKVLDGDSNAGTEGRDVILVMNSYGGIPGTEATKGLSRAERGSDAPSAITALVYIAAFMVPVGVSLSGKLAQVAKEATAKTTEAESNTVETQQQQPQETTPNDLPDYLTLDPTTHPAAIFSDLTPDLQQHYYNLMTTQSRISFDGELTHAGYERIPTTYLLADADKIIPPEVQAGMIEYVNEKAGKEIVKKIVLEGSSHVPMLSRPEEVVEVLVEIATAG